MEISGFYDLALKKNNFLTCDCFDFEEGNCSARILCNQEYTDPTNIIGCVTGKRVEKIDEDGLFLAVICKNDILYIFSDSNTSQWVLYYTVHNNKFFYSTSLKKLLIYSNIERNIDISAAKGFLKNGIVIGNHTLLDNVYKLDVCETIVIKNGTIKHKRTPYSKSKKYGEEDLLPTLKYSIRAYTKSKDRIFMPLSAGFDSNMILNTLLKSPNIEAFTIGGKSGKNEIPIVKDNIKSYKNVTHHTCLADKSLFSKLPEIIWRLDGYVYERGIFLQYLLADLVSKTGGETLICGECSDEHQCLLYGKELKHYLHSKVSPIESLDWMLQPYSWGNFVVIKKSSLMLNSFGINSCYPFATKKFTDAAICVGDKNLDKKQLYIKLLKNELPKDLYDGLTHAGGSTSIEAIISENDIETIKSKVNSNELIKNISSKTEECKKSFWLDFAEVYLEQKGTINFHTIKSYIKYSVKRILHALKLYSPELHQLDNSLETDIKAYYLMLFSELFLSGKYDCFFEKEISDFEFQNI